MPVMNEREQSSAPQPVIGIDLGTTNSLVAVVSERSGAPAVLAGPDGSALVPSVIAFDDAGRTTVGFAARRLAAAEPTTTVFSIKRLMGKGLADLGRELDFLPYHVVASSMSDLVRVEIDGKFYTPQELSAIILRTLKERAEVHFGCEVSKAVITVPAYFDDAQRQATRDAGRIAGLDVLRIVNEPTAAALAYGFDRTREGSVAVYDLGGGTFDVSVLRIRDGVFQVLATHGDTYLGGDDFDREVMNYVRTCYQGQRGHAWSETPELLAQLREQAEAARVACSTADAATLVIQPEGEEPFELALTRGKLDELIAPWVARTIEHCRLAVRDSGLAPGELDGVVMVGGVSRTPLVRRKVAEFFGPNVPLRTEVNPDEVVALGAAVQASILAGATRDLLLLDVTPLSLGIETMGGAVSKLIMRNTHVPCTATERFTTFVDNQTGVKIHVLQGERELVADCRSLGTFELRGLPPMPAGIPKLKVTFLIDADGILHVTAIEERSGKSASVTITPTHGLTKDEVDRMVRESIVQARSDMAAHRLIDLRNQVDSDVRAIRRSMERVGERLTAEQGQVIESAIDEVRRIAAGNDGDAIRRKLDELNRLTLPLAEMSIRKTLDN